MRLGLWAAGMILAACPALAQDVPAERPIAERPIAGRLIAGRLIAGRQIAGRMCGACHGVDGIAKLPEAANLAGQDATYVTRQLTAFRSGERVHEQMSVIAKTLSDQQIADVAAYYGAIQIEVVRTP